MSADSVRLQLRMLAATVVGATAAATLLAAGSTDDRRSTGPASFARPVTEAEKELLHRADQLLLKTCMAKAGFELWPNPYRLVADDRDFPYVIDDPAWAARHGYGDDLVARNERARNTNPNAVYLRSLPPARAALAVTTLNGPTRGPSLWAVLPSGMVVSRSRNGCISHAEETLYGDLDTWYRVSKLSEHLAGVRRGMVGRDPRFQAAVGRWAACVNGKGFTGRRPFDGTRLTDPARKRAAAVAEASCARTTALSDVARSLDAEMEQRLRRDFPRDLAARSRLELAAVAKARTITERHHSP